MNKFLLMAIAFLFPCSVWAAEVTCTVTPSCESLGYKNTSSQCVGSYIACPLDSSKVACMAGTLQIGDLKYSVDGANNNGWLKCDGTQYSQTAYPELYALIGTKFCHKYTSRTDVNYTKNDCKPGYFAVPDYRGFFLRGLNWSNSTSNTVGAPSSSYSYAIYYKGDRDSVLSITHSSPYVPAAEQLPLIFGTGIQLDDHQTTFTIDGALYESSTSGAYDAKSTLSGNKSRLMFDASKSNAIYSGKHVVPASYGAYIYIYAGK